MAQYLMLVLMLGAVEMKSAPSVVKRDAVCYGSLGCFPTSAPFTSSIRPVSPAPEGPDKIKTDYLLYTRESKTTATHIDARLPTGVKSLTNFKARPTKILIHGFLDSPTLTPLWMDMKNELLQHGDYNVIIVDWSNGNEAPYDQACANARVVGAQIAEFIKVVTNNSDINADSFHVIGHSLGAHVSGYIGERVPGLGRITGLDPAGPYFENTDEVVRLDSSDAVFVDAIHTDAKNLLQLGLGTKTPSGHADFYPNKGHDQPGCTYDPLTNIFEEGIISGIEDTVACSHVRAVKYFTESINTPCPFLGFPCSSDEDFDNNLCHSCAHGGCAPFGFKADTAKPPKGQTAKYYLSTADKQPFCVYHATVSIKLTYGQGQEERGKLSVVVHGDQATSNKIQLTSDDVSLKPGSTYKFYLAPPTNLGNIQSVTFSWEQNASLLDPLHWNILGLRHPKLYLDEVDIYREEAGVDVHLCSSSKTVETGSSLTVSTKC